MFNSDNRDAATDTHSPATSSRRSLIKTAGFGAAAAGALALGATRPASAQTSPDEDVAILNFALNLEYLEAEFYLHAVYGAGLSASQSSGAGMKIGTVTGGSRVDFTTTAIKQYAHEIANDELNHVLFLRSALGDAKVARPAIDLSQSFTTLARAAGVVGPNAEFNPFLNEQNFLLGAFIFEDVGVTAYNGAGASITNKSYLTAASSILAVEAYHAASVRLQIIQQGLSGPANKISALRAQLSAAVAPGTGDDQGTKVNGAFNIVPTDSNSLAFARTPGQVLNIVYGGGASSNYLFFPDKMNGTIS